MERVQSIWSYIIYWPKMQVYPQIIANFAILSRTIQVI